MYLEDLIKIHKEMEMKELEVIKGIVNAYYNVDIDTKTRKREIALPRQVFFWLARNEKDDLGVKYTYHQIMDSVLPVNNHATVIHSIKLVDSLIVWDKDFKKDIELLKGIIINEKQKK